MSYKVVYNASNGSFSLSAAAIIWLQDQGFIGNFATISRHHPLLVKCVETLQEQANGSSAYLMVKEIELPLYRMEIDLLGREYIITPSTQFDWKDVNQP